MRTLLALALVVGCGSDHRPVGNGGGPDAGDTGGDACVGLECRIADCTKMGMTPTSISGTVFAPNGTLALYGATVYIPNLDPGPLTDGVSCQRCDAQLPGDPIVQVQSDETGHFELDNVPTGTDVPLVITIGKWRRKVLIPNVNACTDNPLPANLTSLPRNHFQGDIPKIAISTGACDALDCLARRLGIDDTEFSTDGMPGRVHLYNGGGAGTLPNGSAMASSTTLWNSLDKLKNYDVVLLSCECSQNPTNKPQAAMDNIKAYADLGGRVFASHYHNIWIGGEYNTPTHAPAVWKDVATWGDGFADPTIDTIDQDPMHNPKGMSFAKWMMSVGGSTTLGQIPIASGTGRQTANTIDKMKAEQWVYYDSGTQYPQNFQFTTPLEADQANRCGKVVFSDMHVTSDSSSSGQFPSGCSSSPLSAQEKALAFMFFDIASCVQVIQ